jgi:hypothetical protein
MKLLVCTSNFASGGAASVAVDDAICTTIAEKIVRMHCDTLSDLFRRGCLTMEDFVGTNDTGSRQG